MENTLDHGKNDQMSQPCGVRQLPKSAAKRIACGGRGLHQVRLTPSLTILTKNPCVQFDDSIDWKEEEQKGARRFQRKKDKRARKRKASECALQYDSLLFCFVVGLIRALIMQRTTQMADQDPDPQRGKFAGHR